MDDAKILNGVLCFMKSALNDFTKDELIDIVKSYYSIEDIIKAKSLIYLFVYSIFEFDKQ